MAIKIDKSQPQVFLTFASVDRVLADEVGAVLRSEGLSVIRVQDVRRQPAADSDFRMREVLKNCAAVVVVLSDVSNRRGLPASVLFEIGAATGAGKPIFVVLDQSSHPLPFGVPGMQIIPTNRVDEIARQLSHAPQHAS